MIEKYPHNPQLRNYLSAAYTVMGKDKKSREVNETTLKQFPGYFYALIKKASDYSQDGKYEKIPELLGKDFNLKSLYPERDVFHISEFMEMQQMAVFYYLGIDDVESAEERLDLMQEIDSDTRQYEQAEDYYSFYLQSKSLQRNRDEKKASIIPINAISSVERNFKFPDQHYKVTSELYYYNYDIPEEVLDQFYKLDREKVIEDLENVLRDSYKNFDLKNEVDIGFEAIHALLLLGELGAEESLPVVLEMMQEGEDYFDYYSRDFYTEDAWIPLMKISINQLDLLAEYLRIPDTYIYFRSTVIDVLHQIVYHFPEKKDKVFKIYKDYLEFLIDAEYEDKDIDIDFNGLLVSDLVDLQLIEFLPQIKKIYKKGYVALNVSGSYESVAQDIKNPDYPYGKREIKSNTELYDFYRYLNERNNHPSHPMSDKEFGKLLAKQFKGESVVREQKKIGRNEPCPCGSGKKFKKCCLGKGIYD